MGAADCLGVGVAYCLGVGVAYCLGVGVADWLGVGGLNVGVAYCLGVGVADCWCHIFRCRCCCLAGRGEREAVRELEGRGLFLKSAEVATIAGTQASDVLAGKATTAVSHI